jgi:hypothetical protein
MLAMWKQTCSCSVCVLREEDVEDEEVTVIPFPYSGHLGGAHGDGGRR